MRRLLPILLLLPFLTGISWLGQGVHIVESLSDLGDLGCGVGDPYIVWNDALTQWECGAGGSGGSITVAEADDVPTVSSVSTLKFDQADGFAVTDSGGGVATVGFSGGSTHEMLSATHSDSTVGAVVRGDIITGQGVTPTWTKLGLSGGATAFLGQDGTDVSWETVGISDLAVSGLTVPDVLQATGAASIGFSRITLSQVASTTEGQPYWVAASDLFYIGAGGGISAIFVPIDSTVNNSYCKLTTPGSKHVVEFDCSSTKVPHTDLANAAAWTLLLNNTAGSAAPSAVKVSALTEEASPAAGDWLLGEEQGSTSLAKFNVSKFALVGDIPAGANPTASIAAAAVNGSAGTFMRSDGAPALPAKFRTQHCVIAVESATTSDLIMCGKVDTDVTLVSMACIGTGSPSGHTVELFECTTGGITCTTATGFTATISTTQSIDTTCTNCTIETDKWFRLDTTAVTTAADWAYCDIEYTVD